MSGNGHIFVEWKEEFVSQERGNRVVHYFLKDSAGESILAVIGTERSVRHMFYVVAEEFVKVYGPEHSIHAGFKWRSRREVVDWLTSMLSKQHLYGDRSKSPKDDEVQVIGSPECAVNGIGARKPQSHNDMGHHPRNVNGHSSDIVWSGIAWTCGKQLKHYPAFSRNGTTIAIQSFVFVMAKGENHYVAYLEDMYEDKRGQKKVKVRWFHHNKEVKGVIPLRNPHPKEVFITPYSQVISAECVDGPATVLTREDYEKCVAAFPNALLARVHLCSRQFRNNRVKPFDLSKLRGYRDQPILSCLNSSAFAEPDSISHGLNKEEEDELAPCENVKPGSKRTRTGKGLVSLKQNEYQPCCGLVFKVDEKIEFLCQDSGIRGCWFRCTILQVSRKQMKVQYDDLLDEDDYGNLEEWIPAFKLAMPDKLDMRYSGRPTVRPPPPPSTQTELAFPVGTAVDAWWSDGWWEGVVVGVSNNDDNNMQIYFPGEGRLLNINKKDLRVSRDWVGDHWMDIEAKPDILSVISAAISPDTKISISSSIAKDFNSEDFNMSVFEVPSCSKLNDVEEEKPDVTTHASGESIPEEVAHVKGKNLEASNDVKDGDGTDDKKPPSVKNEGSRDGDDSNVILHKLDDMQLEDHDRDDSDIGNDRERGNLEMEHDTSGQNSKPMELMGVTA